MQNFPDSFETCERSFIRRFSICMGVSQVFKRNFEKFFSQTKLNKEFVEFFKSIFISFSLMLLKVTQTFSAHAITLFFM